MGSSVYNLHPLIKALFTSLTLENFMTTKKQPLSLQNTELKKRLYPLKVSKNHEK